MKAFITIKELREIISEGEASKEDVLSFFYDRIRRYGEKLNAFIDVFDSPVSRNGDVPDSARLKGIPFGVKNNIALAGKRLTCASKILEHYTVPYTATVVERLLDAGGAAIATMNMDEFAMGASGEFSAFGPAKNPWDLERTAGGSSSGSAAAVAAGLLPFALGSETGGSVRQPAAFCGLVGIYPTYGRFSRYGLVAFASSTDQIAPITRTVYDNALVASAMSGHDDRDGTSAPMPAQDFAAELDGEIPERLRVGVMSGSFDDVVSPEVKEAVEATIKSLERMGASFVGEIQIPHAKYGIHVYMALAYSEGASNLSRFDGTIFGDRPDGMDNPAVLRANLLGEEVKRRILLGNYMLSSEHRVTTYERAVHVRNMLRAEFESAFSEADVIISPTVVESAFKLGELVDDPVKLYYNDLFSIPNTLVGYPGITVPAGVDKRGMPIAVQFVGKPFSEALLYRVAFAYERTVAFYDRHPDGFE